MIRSKLKLLLRGEGEQSLLTFVDEAMRGELQQALMELQYSQELSLLYILQDDIDRAKYYAEQGIQIFMQVMLVDRSSLRCCGPYPGFAHTEQVLGRWTATPAGHLTVLKINK